MGKAAKYLGNILLVVYIVLITFAILKTQIKSVPVGFILGGCILNVIYILFDVFKYHRILLLIIGMVSISAGTLLNGIMQNNVHIQHHVIRFIFEAIIVVLCSKCKKETLVNAFKFNISKNR